MFELSQSLGSTTSAAILAVAFVLFLGLIHAIASCFDQNTSGEVNKDVEDVGGKDRKDDSCK